MQYCDTRRRKGEQTGKTNRNLNHHATSRLYNRPGASDLATQDTPSVVIYGRSPARTGRDHSASWRDRGCYLLDCANRSNQVTLRIRECVATDLFRESQTENTKLPPNIAVMAPCCYDGVLPNRRPCLKRDRPTEAHSSRRCENSSSARSHCWSSHKTTIALCGDD